MTGMRDNMALMRTSLDGVRSGVQGKAYDTHSVILAPPVATLGALRIKRFTLVKQLANSIL